jgi:hypothetical protein
MTTKTSRRGFIKAAAVASAGAAVGSSLINTPADAQPTAGSIQSARINRQAKAILSGGKIVSREEVLSQLGLNPQTPPDAWLAIVACGSNASALKPGELQELVKSGQIKREIFDKKLDQKSIQMVK